MKSAIFQDSGMAGQTRQPRKQPSKKWPRTSSPFLVSSATSLSWNLEDMLSNYTASGVLPPPLSPTLPPRFATKNTTEQNGSKDVASDDDVDTDSLPLSLLSPTLPSMFRNTESKPATPALAHPLPEKPSTVYSVLHANSKPARSSRVRWVDKLNDPSKPRFLLRISFSSQADALKKISRSASDQDGSASPVAVQGLAISGLKQDTESSVRSTWPRSYKDFLSRYTKSAKEDTLVSILAQFDWILCSAIVSDSTRLKNKTNRPSDDSWTRFLADIPSFVHRIERFIKTNNVSDRKRSYLSLLVGILAVCKALALKRENAVLQSSIEALSADSSLESKQKTIALQDQIIQNYRKMEEHFAESQSFFKNSPSPATVFPKTWSSRTQSIPKPSDSIISPSSDAYFLPLGPYSGLSEACAFLYGCLREFGDILEVELDSGARYHLQSGQRP